MFDLLFYSAAMEVREWARANKGKIAALVVVVVLSWELYVAKEDTPWRPSCALEVVAEWVAWWWYCVGRGFAGVCDIVRDMLGERIGIVALRIGVPIVELFFSWLHVLRGMSEYVQEYAMSADAVVIGFWVACITTVTALVWFRIPSRVFARVCGWLPELKLMDDETHARIFPPSSVVGAGAADPHKTQ